MITAAQANEIASRAFSQWENTVVVEILGSIEKACTLGTFNTSVLTARLSDQVVKKLIELGYKIERGSESMHSVVSWK